MSAGHVLAQPAGDRCTRAAAQSRLGIAASAAAGFCVLLMVWTLVHLGGTRPTVLDTGAELVAALAGAACWATAAARATRNDAALMRRLAARVTVVELLAGHDALTGLAHRAHLRDRTVQALSRRTADDGAPAAVLFLELDDLAMVTTSLGEAAGDRLLVAVAQRLRASASAADVVARIGGGTFAVLVPGAGRTDDLDRVTERILDALAEPADIGDGVSVHCGAAVGVAVAGPPDISADELFRRADVALHAARTAGKGLVGFFRPSLRVTLARRAEGPEAGRRHLVAVPGVDGEDRVRQWLARELHDGAVQTLTAMLMEMEELRRELPESGMGSRILDLQTSLRSALGSLRALLLDAREQAGEDHRLVDDLSALLEHLDGRTGIKGELTVSPSWPRSLSAQISCNLRRIVEEALRNVALHSRAQRVMVSLDAEEERLTLTVSDDGHGAYLPPTLSPAGTGILGMQERAVLLGGQLEITSLPGTGTTVRGTFATRTA
jgi:diguanylate cyclase (GGDEF)-like protein